VDGRERQTFVPAQDRKQGSQSLLLYVLVQGRSRGDVTGVRGVLTGNRGGEEVQVGCYGGGSRFSDLD